MLTGFSLYFVLLFCVGVFACACNFYHYYKQKLYTPQPQKSSAVLGFVSPCIETTEVNWVRFSVGIAVCILAAAFLLRHVFKSFLTFTVLVTTTIIVVFAALINIASVFSLYSSENPYLSCDYNPSFVDPSEFADPSHRRVRIQSPHPECIEGVAQVIRGGVTGLECVIESMNGFKKGWATPSADSNDAKLKFCDVPWQVQKGQDIENFNPFSTSANQAGLMRFAYYMVTRACSGATPCASLVNLYCSEPLQTAPCQRCVDSLMDTSLRETLQNLCGSQTAAGICQSSLQSVGDGDVETLENNDKLNQFYAIDFVLLAAVAMTAAVCLLDRSNFLSE